jgi:Zn-dependent protease
MSSTWLAERTIAFIPLLLSLSVHEWAHAWAADRLGDDTPRHQGRLTVDPFAHVDFVGTALLPFLGVPFGWAKPVVFNPNRLRGSERRGVMLVALAGPASNLVLAFGCLGVSLVLGAAGAPDSLEQLARTAAWMNLFLAVGNLLPIPPLDGSRVVEWALPDSLRPAWNQLHSVGPVVMAVLLVVVSSLLGGAFALARLLLFG